MRRDEVLGAAVGSVMCGAGLLWNLSHYAEWAFLLVIVGMWLMLRSVGTSIGRRIPVAQRRMQQRHRDRSV